MAGREAGLSPVDSSNRRRISRFIIAFIVLYVLGVTALRGQFGLRYNDTALYKSVHSYPFYHDIGRVSKWVPTLPENGGQTGNYRPLQAGYTMFAFTAAPKIGVIPLYFLCFALLGLSAYVIFRLVSECCDTRTAAVTAVTYLLFPPVVSSSWIPLAGPQSLIPLSFALSALFYKWFLDTAQRRYLIPVFLVSLVGVYYKEALATVPILLLIHYLLFAENRRPAVAVSLLAASLHGLFPVMLPALFLTGRPSTISIFQLGSLGDQIGRPAFRVEFALDLVDFVPPIIRIPFLVSAAAIAFTRRAEYAPRLPGWIHVPAFTTLRIATVAAAVAGTICTLGQCLAFDLAKSSSVCFLATAFGYSLLYMHPLISGWLATMLIGIARIYFNVTQCGYVAAPLLCTLTHAGFQCFALVSVRREKPVLMPRMATGTLLICASLAFLDLSLALPNAYRAFRATEAFYRELVPASVQAQLQHPMCARDMIHFTNTVLADDAVATASGCRIVRGFYASDFGVPPSHILENEDILKQEANSKDTILYVADYVPPFKRQFLELRQLKKHYEPLGVVDVGWSAWFADPLRLLIRNRYSTMVGPPDFQDELDRANQPFRVTYSNRIWIGYRPRGGIQTAGLKFVNHRVEVRLVEEGVAGYNLLMVQDRYVAIPQGMGEFDRDKFIAGGYPELPTADSPAELRKLLVENPVSVRRRPPIALVEEGVLGHNILRVEGVFLALPQTTGAFDLECYRQGRYGKLIQGKSPEEVRRAVIAAARGTKRH